MPDVFGIEGGLGGKPDKKKKVAPIGGKAATRGDPDILYGSMNPAAGETKKQEYVQYDNESGAIMIDIPPQFSKYKRELEEDLMEEFYADPAGGAESTKSIDAWVKEWLHKKAEEDPELKRQLDLGDDPAP